MRIAIPSLPSPESLSLKATLERAGYLIVTDFPSYTITLIRGEHPWIVVDVPDAKFGRLLTHRIGELAPWDGVFLKASGGNLNDKAAIVAIPDDNPKALTAVCVGTMRALDQLQKLATEPAKQAAAPFLNASELLANAVQLLETRIDAHSATVTTALAQATKDTHTLGDTHRDQLLQAITSATEANCAATHTISDTHRDQLLQAITSATGANAALVVSLNERIGYEHRQLFTDLMAYYTRPRWWQKAYWR